MTDRMFLLDPEGWGRAEPGTEVEVTGDEGRHAVTVVKVLAGETVLLGGGGRRASAVVTHTGRDAFTARLVDVTSEADRVPRFVLVQALAKGGRDEQAVETTTELGVDEVVPWQAERSVVVWRDRDRAEKGRRRWTAVAVAATKQARRARVPAVAAVLATTGVCDRVRGAALALVLDEAAEASLAGVDLPEAGDVLVVVGPEGGITPRELDALGQAGALAVRLGPEVLRSSSAGPAALAALSVRSRWR